MVWAEPVVGGRDAEGREAEEGGDREGDWGGGGERDLRDPGGGVREPGGGVRWFIREGRIMDVTGSTRS